MTKTLAAQVQDFLNAQFPESTLTEGFGFISIKSRRKITITNEAIHQAVVNRLCESLSWMISVNIAPTSVCHTALCEERTFADYRYWDAVDTHTQYFAELHGSFDLGSVPKISGPNALYLVFPRQDLILNVLTFELYANHVDRIFEALEGIEPLQRPYDELTEFLATTFPDVRRTVGAALMEFHADATRPIAPTNVQAVVNKLGEHTCWLIATSVPHGIVPRRTDPVIFHTPDPHQQVVAEVTGPMDVEALFRAHEAPHTLALVDPQSGVIFSLPDRTLYGTTQQALAAFVVGIDGFPEPR